MAPVGRQTPLGAEVWALANRQHGVIDHAQLLACGFTREAIKHRVRTRRLHPTWRGVYAVGRPALNRFGWWMAAILACGRRAVLSHESAAQLWGIRPMGDGPIHVTVGGTSARRLRGIRAHRRKLGTTDITEHHAIPVTRPALTLIDIATYLAANELEAAINEADKLDLITPDELSAEIEARPGTPGVRALRKILDRPTFALTDSALERRFLPISAHAGLPVPRTQVSVNGFRVDFYYEEIGLIVETDGLRYHRTPAQQARDRLRDQTHTAAGLTTLRFTHAQIRYEPSRVEQVLATVHARLSPEGADRPPEATIDERGAA
jgi:very-short-patch-repair endonuclease